MGNDQIKIGAVPDKEMQEDKREGDEATEMKEIANEWAGEEHHYDLEKENQMPSAEQRMLPSLEKEGTIDLEEANLCEELPTLEGARNPEIKEEEQKQQQQDIQSIDQSIKTSPQPTQQLKQAVCSHEADNLVVNIDKCSQMIPSIPQILQVTQFSPTLKSSTISLNESSTLATQTGNYWQNGKLILSEPIKSPSKATFRVVNLKYCVGMGVALKEITEKHDYNYKSYQNELSHGLFLVTSQGYSWSHVYKAEDDCLRPEFKKMKNNDRIKVELEHDSVKFIYQKEGFKLSIPESVIQKYTLCLCAYLHEKTDSVSFENCEEPIEYENRIAQ